MLKACVYGDPDIIRCTPMSVEQAYRARVALPSMFEKVDNPADAQIYWLGIDAGHIEAYHGGAQAVAKYIPRLPYWKGNERRHVAYFCSDGAEPTGLPCIMFRASYYKDRADPNVVAWPYAVEDFGDLVTSDFSSLKYDVSFVGAKASHISRIESFDSVLAERKLTSFLDDSKMHWGSIEHTEIGKRRKELFIQSMRESVLVLAARGGGLSCYRFFEAMSAGRIPVLLADDWALPHADLIDWDNIIIKIPECQAKHTGRILLDYLQRASNDVLAEMGAACRQAWVKYLAPVVWPEMMERCVKARL